MKNLKEEAVYFQIKKGVYTWEAEFSLDSEDKPILKLFKDKVEFDMLIEARKYEILYRQTKINNFKGRIKKTEFHFFSGENLI